MSIKFIWCIIIIILFFFFQRFVFLWQSTLLKTLWGGSFAWDQRAMRAKLFLTLGEPIELVLNITASNSSHCINFCVYSLPNVESLKWHCRCSKNRTTRIRGRRCSGIFFKALEIKCFGSMGRQVEADAVTVRHVERDCGISS